MSTNSDTDDLSGVPPTSAVVSRLAQPQWLGWVRRQKKRVGWPLTALIDKISEIQLLDIISALDGLIHAFEAASAALDSTENPHTAQVRIEATETIRAATYKLDRIAKKYPIQFAQIRSATTAAQIIAHQKMVLQRDRLVYSERTWDKVEAKLDTQQTDLRCDRTRFGGASQGRAGEALPIRAPPPTTNRSTRLSTSDPSGARPPCCETAGWLGNVLACVSVCARTPVPVLLCRQNLE